MKMMVGDGTDGSGKEKVQEFRWQQWRLQWQSGSKSGDRGSGQQKFSFHQKKYTIFKKNLRFSRQKITMTFFSPQLKTMSFLPKTVNCYHLHLHNRLHSWLIFLLFLKKKHFPTYFLCQIGYSILRDPSTTASPKSGGRGLSKNVAHGWMRLSWRT